MSEPIQVKQKIEELFKFHFGWLPPEDTTDPARQFIDAVVKIVEAGGG